MKHIPVMLLETLRFFSETKIKCFFDGTLGAGGHAKALLESHSEIEAYIACDKDEKALSIAAEVLKPWREKVFLFKSSFVKINELLKNCNVKCVNGALFDLGLSSMQLADAERGFSFNASAPLDMRMNREEGVSAKEVVNRFSEQQLAEIFWAGGEERRSKIAAKAIVEGRRKKRIETTSDLLEVLAPVIKRRGKIHGATLIFQALRIFVNHEFEELQELLKEAPYLCKRGRMVVISFHSLEDRIVKNAFRDLSKKGEGYYLITKKPLTPTREEIKNNIRSRSAKMRVLGYE